MGFSNNTDLTIVGGGLAGSLLAFALKRRHPHLKIELHEKSDRLCGNHTWCLHDHDIPAGDRDWIEECLDKTWSGYDVHFPKYSRTLNGKYHSIKSESLAQKVMAALTGDAVALNSPISKEDLQGHIPGAVVLAQGWSPLTVSPDRVGWQKFLGLELELSAPHHLYHPILKDVLQKQTDGYRFVYSLPFTETSVLIEDTYYSNSSDLDLAQIRGGILKYAAQKGWKVKKILREEVGKLPLYLDLPARTVDYFPRIGAGSEFLNPVTGYTLPMTLKTISEILKLQVFTNESIKQAIDKVESTYKPKIRYLTWLNRMMFLAAEPTKRYQILERFYQLNEGLIDRFYSGNLKKRDQLRILMGKPPVPVFKAIKALLKTPQKSHSE